MFAKFSNNGRLSDRKKSSFICFIIVVVIYHILMREYWGDAVNYFGKVLQEKALLEYLSIRYNTWTSRLLIEIPLVYLGNQMFLFKICNTIMYIVFALSLDYLTHSKCRNAVFALVLIYPVSEMASAGWIATCINYLWPVALMALAFISLEKIWFSKKIRSWEALIYFIAIVFATNHEQSCVMAFIILICFIIYCITQRKFKNLWICIIELIITIVNLLFILTCPGNTVRNTSEIATWMKDYQTLSVFDKVALGINSTFDELVSGDSLFFVFVTVIFLCAIKNAENMENHQTKRVVRIMACIPFLFVLIRTVFKPIMVAYFPAVDGLFDNIPTVDSVNYYNFETYIPFIAFVLLFIFVLVALLNLFDDVSKGIEMALIFMTGMITRVAMGFSPTLYASGPRTFLFLKVSMIFCILRILEYCDFELTTNPKINAFINRIFMVFTILAILNNIVMIY